MDLKENNILLEVVDGELKVFAETSPDPSLIAEIKKRKAELLQILSGNGGSAMRDTSDFLIPLASRETGYVLSSSQKRLWLLNQLEPDSAAYNLRGIHVFEGEIDQVALDYAFNNLILRHEVLRTVFQSDAAGEVKQYVKEPDAAGITLTRIDFRNRDAAALNELILKEISAPFDLSAGPLIRATLYQTGSGSWVFCFFMHHIIGDAWSTGVLIRELLTLYNAHLNGQPNPLKQLRIQYKDYAVWQQHTLVSMEGKQQRAYWLKQFEGDIPVLKLQTGKVRPARKSEQGSVCNYTINSRLTENIKKLIANERGTVFMGMLALVNTLFYKYTGQEDIIIGTSIASRENLELENQIGFYVNTLPLRTRFDGNDNFSNLFNKVREVTLGAYSHQAYPFDELVDALNIERDNSRHPLFDVMVVLQNINISGREEEQKLNGVRVSSFDGASHVVNKFDLTFFVTDTGKELVLRIVYNKDIYDEQLINRMAVHLEHLIDAVTGAPALTLKKLDILDESERSQLLEDFGASAVTYPEGKNIASLFDEQVEKTPGTIALIAGNNQLTYKELHEKANRLATYLTTDCRIGANDRVAIMMERSEKVLIAIMGVLKAGAAYIVIEPDTPKARQAYIMSDAEVKVLVTQTDYVFDLDYFEGHIFALDIQIDTIPSSAPISPVISPEHLAYVVYTSGTTGQPKGVMVTHGNVIDYFYGLLAATNVNACSSFGLVSTMAADLGNTVVYAALLTGGTLQIFSVEEAIDAKRMAGQQLDCIKIVPSHWKALQDGEQLFLPEKCLIFGGEALTGDVIEIIRKAPAICEVYNHYGPSETTIGKLLNKVDKIESNIPLGKPFGNTDIYILNEDGSLLPQGVAGEIYIGGRGVAAGYLNRPELTAQKFVPDPFGKTARIYRTGDNGLWLPDGKVLFLGRKDDQVKIRGYRIELAEIERTLLAFEGISAAVVTARTHLGGDKELVGYWVSIEEIDVPTLRTYLTNSLPGYMVPSYLLRLDQLPVTANGKIDRKRLPAPESAANAGFVAPRNNIERQLVGLWQEVLNRAQVSVTDNFFDIGGHSLRATRLVSLIHKTFQVNIGLRDIFATLVLEDQARLIANARHASWAPIEPAPASLFGYPLSSSQYRLWVLSQYEEGNVGYNVPAAHVFEGNLNAGALNAALKALIDRHEILRTVFREDRQGQVKQFILSADEPFFQLVVHDLSDQAGQEEKARELVDEAFHSPFDLACGPLIRTALIRLSDDKWIFTYVMHHIISDAWSKGILIKELLFLYNGYLNGDVQELPKLKIQYKDFAVWQHNRLHDGSLDVHKGYWLEKFEGELPVLEMPADKPRPVRRTYNGAFANRKISKQAIDRVKSLNKGQESTLFITLTAAVNVLLYRYTGQEDIITGTLTAGREYSGLEDQIGFYINTLPLRARFKGTDNFLDLQQYIGQLSLDAFEHQQYPFDELIKDLEIQHDSSRNPLFDVCIVLQNARNENDAKGDLQGLAGSNYQTGKKISSRFDLIFDFVEHEDYVRAGLVYNTDIYKHSTAERLLQHLEQLLDVIVNEPGKPVKQLDYLSDTEKQQLLYGFNDTRFPYPHDKTITALFREQASLSPASIALIAGNTILTYATLDEQSDKLAVYLQEKHGVGQGDFVGILMERSEQLVIAILGIMKAGAAYVPVDTVFPDDRKLYLLMEAGCKVVITQLDYISGLHAFEGGLVEMEIEAPAIAACERFPLSDIDSTAVAYVMYTSGSTGMPKGVLIPHRAVVRLVKPGNFAAVASTDTLLSTGAVAFDATTFEYWSMLLNGGILVLCDNNTLLDSTKLSALIKQHRVTIMWFTSGWLNQLVDEDLMVFDQLKTILVGGDRLSATHIHLLQQQYPDLRIINGYGPTENTTFSTTATLAPGVEPITIGRPIDNSIAYILDDEGQLCPVGVNGEIHVGGGLATGYLKNEELTKAKFIPDPFRENERIYKTGDLGRWMPDGNILFIGRKDDQVKINGYRVEPGEIAHVLQTCPGVRSSVVTVNVLHNGEKELVAYYVADKQLDAPTVKYFLADKLPVFMVPAYLIQLDELPLNLNGKVDRKRLPRPQAYLAADQSAFVAPRNKTEEKLLSIWQEILLRQEISVKDNFFDVGGHSLRATRLVSLIHKAFEINIGLKDIFAIPVLEDQAIFIESARQETFVPILPVAVSSSGYPLSASQYRLWILCHFEDVNVAYNVKDVQVFRGSLNSDALVYAFNELIARHEILRTVFREDEDGHVKQFVLLHGELNFNIAMHDLREKADRVEMARQLVQEDFTCSFDLSAGPLIRASLIRTAEDEWIFTYITHHIISDGWSRSIIMHELMSFYHGYLNAQAPALRPLHIQYKDFSVWQQEQLSADKQEHHKAYWLGQFAGSLPVIDLPADKPRPAVKTYRGAAVRTKLSKPVSDGIRLLAEEHDSTLFMVLVAAVNVLLYRYTSQEDIVIGSPIAGREHADLEDQIGFYVNTLALRTRFKGDDTFNKLLENVREVALGAYEHQIYPFDKLVADLQLQRDRSRNPLFDIQVIVQNAGQIMQSQYTSDQGLAMEGYGDAVPATCVFDMVFDFNETPDGLKLRIAYNCDIYSDWLVSQLGRHLEQLLTGIIESPDSPINQLEFLDSLDKQLLLPEAAVRPIVYPDRTITDLFEEQVLLTPDQTALVSGVASFTYTSLNDKANELAVYLQQTYDLKSNELVGIVLDRSESIAIAILGILKAGGAYVFIHPEYPRTRKEYLIKDTGIKLLLTKAENLFDLDFYEGPIHAVDMPTNTVGQRPQKRSGPEDLMYVIYTSGSTGAPKGVAITHRGLVNTVQAVKPVLDVPAGTNSLQLASWSFDASVFEMFCALTGGQALHIVDEETRKNPNLLQDYIISNNIGFAVITPAYLRMLEIDKIRTIKKLVTAGEAAIADKAREYLQYGTYFNAYGPTETSICVTVMTIPAHGTITKDNVPIGLPISNSPVYILDNNHRLVPAGVAGEICVGGAGLAKEYLNKPEQTVEKFVPNPFIAGERMYKTGDLGRWLPDGNIEYLGRKDEQVKINGYRIEPAEIEQALKFYPEVKEAVVVVQEQEDRKELVAYVVGTAPLYTSDLVVHLTNHIPVFMLPARFVQLEVLPITTNGKVDKKTLPLFDESATSIEKKYIAPANEIETTLVSIWEEVLGRDRISTHDDYFELGGDSLKAMVILKRILDTTGTSITMKVLFEEKTIEAIARHIPAAVLAVPSYNQLAYFSDWLRKGDDLIVVPYEADNIDISYLTTAVNQLADRHEVLRTSFVLFNGSIMQRILPPGSLQIVVEETMLSGKENDKESLIKIAHTWEPNLSKGPLFQVNLYHWEDNRSLVLISMHHIISDGYSIGVLKKELTTLYTAAVLKGNAPAPLKYQYRHFSAWQHKFVNNADGKASQQYWLDKLQGSCLAVNFPAYESDSAGMNNLAALLEAELYAKVDRFARKNGLTKTSLLLGVLYLMLHQLTNQEDITVMTTVSGRNSRCYQDMDVSGLIGFFANLVAVRNKLSDPGNIINHLKQVQSGFLDDLHHDAYPFEKLVHELFADNADKSLASAVFFNYHNYDYNKEVNHASRVNDDVKTGENMTHYALVVVVKEYKNCLKFNFIFNGHIFPYAQRVHIRDLFVKQLNQVIDAD